MFSEPKPLFFPIIIKDGETLDKLELLRARGNYELVLSRFYFMKAIRPSFSRLVRYAITVM
jgi:hypothetical protein